MSQPKNILIAPLNWGLGHATRCIPIIRKYDRQGHRIIIASDGAALQLLQKEFPHLSFVSLPGYNITYARRPWYNSLHLLRQLPHIWQTMRAEQKQTAQLIDQYAIDFLISDNRFGVYSKRVKSVYITHQLRVMSGLWTFLTTFLHARIYQKYDEIWVPDTVGNDNLSGKLGHLSQTDFPIKYIGIQTRMQPAKMPVKYQYLAVLSGPEPQRRLFEQILLKEFEKAGNKVALIQGKMAETPTCITRGMVDIYNYVTTESLQNLLNRSDIIIARSGYTSVMDLHALRKKVIWVPTPGQPEQKYLARYLARKYGHKVQTQDNFKLEF